MSYPSAGGGGTSFAIGPVRNEFRAATRSQCMVLVAAEGFAEPAWLAVYDSAPLSDTGILALNIRIFYAVDDIQYMELLARDNGNWVVNETFQGIVGPQGTPGDGVKSSFNSIAEMNNFYITDDRFTGLKTGDNNSVTINGAVFQYEWAGIDTPSEYNPDLFRLAEIGTTAGSLIMGPTSIESGSEVLMFKSATGGQHYIVQSFFDQTGSKVPQYYDAGPVGNFDLALVDTDSLALPIDFETIFPDTNIFTTYTIKPSLKGSFQFQTFLGTKSSHDQFPILSENIEILEGDVGTDLTVNMKNPAVINAGQELYTELSGEAKLFGGLQTEGPEVDQITMYAKLGMQTVTKYDLALVADLSDSTINPGLGKVKAAGNLGLLADQLIAGTNINLTKTNNDITITASGGALDGAEATVLDGYINIDYDAPAETDSQLIQADKAGTVLTRPEYTTSTKLAGDVIVSPIGVSVFPNLTFTPFVVTETTDCVNIKFTLETSLTDVTSAFYIHDAADETINKSFFTVLAANTGSEQTVAVVGGIVFNPGTYGFCVSAKTLGDTEPQFSYVSTGLDVTQQISLITDYGGGGGGGGGEGLSGAKVTVDASTDVLDVAYTTSSAESQILQSMTTDGGDTYLRPTLVTVKGTPFDQLQVGFPINSEITVNNGYAYSRLWNITGPVTKITFKKGAADLMDCYFVIKQGAGVVVWTSATKDYTDGASDIVFEGDNLFTGAPTSTQDIFVYTSSVDSTMFGKTTGGIYIEFISNGVEGQVHELAYMSDIGSGGTVNLLSTPASDEVVILNSSGTDATIAKADTNLAGVMSAATWNKLDGIATGAEVNVPTNLVGTPSATDYVVTNDNGTTFTIPISTPTEGGIFAAEDDVKLGNIEDGAQVNVQSDLSAVAGIDDVVIGNTDGTGFTLLAATTSLAGNQSSADKTKLDGISTGAEVNIPSDLAYATGTRLVSNTNGTGFEIPVASATIDGLITSSGFDNLEKVAIDVADLAPGYLFDKITGGGGVTIVKDGGTVKISSDATGDLTDVAIDGSKGQLVATYTDGSKTEIPQSDINPADGKAGRPYYIQAAGGSDVSEIFNADTESFVKIPRTDPTTYETSFTASEIGTLVEVAVIVKPGTFASDQQYKFSLFDSIDTLIGTADVWLAVGRTGLTFAQGAVTLTPGNVYTLEVLDISLVSDGGNTFVFGTDTLNLTPTFTLDVTTKIVVQVQNLALEENVNPDSTLTYQVGFTPIQLVEKNLISTSLGKGKYKFEVGANIQTVSSQSRGFVAITVWLDGVEAFVSSDGASNISVGDNYGQVAGVFYYENTTEIGVAVLVSVTATSVTNTKTRSMYSYITKI
ncbi:MAG: hypothetical protein JKY14_13750 [Paraglaciecola sp.]|nr:hypothetical protein [Paraglaciecola sp.]